MPERDSSPGILQVTSALRAAPVRSSHAFQGRGSTAEVLTVLMNRVGEEERRVRVMENSSNLR